MAPAPARGAASATVLRGTLLRTALLRRPSRALVHRAVLALLVTVSILGFVVLVLAFALAVPAAAQVATPGAQSALHPAGPAMARIGGLGTLYVVVFQSPLFL